MDVVVNSANVLAGISTIAGTAAGAVAYAQKIAVSSTDSGGSSVSTLPALPASAAMSTAMAISCTKP
jgi:hypothetical protein